MGLIESVFDNVLQYNQILYNKVDPTIDSKVSLQSSPVCESYRDGEKTCVGDLGMIYFTATTWTEMVRERMWGQVWVTLGHNASYEWVPCMSVYEKTYYVEI